MPDQDKTKEQLVEELADLMKRILKNLGGSLGAIGDIGYGGELYFTLPSEG
jgi:hypothetical protein